MRGFKRRGTHDDSGHRVENDILEPRADVIEHEKHEESRRVERARLDDQDEHWPQVAMPEACKDMRPVDLPDAVCYQYCRVHVRGHIPARSQYGYSGGKRKAHRCI